MIYWFSGNSKLILRLTLRGVWKRLEIKLNGFTKLALQSSSRRYRYL